MANQAEDAFPVELHIDDNRIVHLRLKQNVNVTLPLVEYVLDKIGRLTGGEKRPIVADISNLAFSEPDARRFASQAGRQVVSAVAFVTDSPVSRIIATFFLKINRPAYPIQIFRTKPEAIAWLKTHSADKER